MNGNKGRLTGRWHFYVCVALVYFFTLLILFLYADSKPIGLSTDIFAYFVGLCGFSAVVWQLWTHQNEMREKNDWEFAERQSIILMGIIYGKRYQEGTHYAPNVEWYRFHFLRGVVNGNGTHFIPWDRYVRRLAIDDKISYLNEYQKMIQSIKTKEVRNFYENSTFGKIYKYW